ncbi:marine proteobacterial sortase target protein [Betaproteobacteria bacterium GR16-43]|nr:marine proteobacterial sortase target protein [Betaproteobacteria bacterium GR16-43]
MDGQIKRAMGWAGLLGKAVASGVAVSLALAVLALGLSTTARAATLNDTKMGSLLYRTEALGEYTVAPRVETEVAIQVTGLIARTRVTQVFHNPGTESVEGVYVFPLPDKAAVDRLSMRIGERTIEGQIREKEEARRVYEQAKSEGKKAALVEQQRPNLFTNSIAHIGPNEMVRVTIEYQQALAFDNGEYRLRFPLAVTPRYTPGAPAIEAPPEEPKAVEAGAVPVVNPDQAPDGCGPVNPVDIVVMIDAGAPISKITSSYHEATIEKVVGIEKTASHRVVVYLSKNQEESDRDFELVWTPSPGAKPAAALFTEAKAGNEYALLMVIPPEPTDLERSQALRVPRETILVVDTSGSMTGSPMEQAKQALLIALSTLQPEDRFNIIEFNSEASMLFPDALPASATTLQRARAWVKGLRANGGTEMIKALNLALPMDAAGRPRETPGYLRQVIFATDGGVSNEDELFAFIHKRLGGSRLFTVGIGSAPNGHFMTKAAQFGRGTFTYIGDLNELQQKMASLFAKLEAPVLKDVSIRWADGSDVETFPARVPDLYLGEPIVVSASMKPASKTVIVSGVRGNQPWSVALTPSPSHGESSGVGALWARAKIATLMDEIRTGGDVESLRPKIVKVALDHHLVSAYTSLVAVDVTPTAVSERLKTAMVRTAAPRNDLSAGSLPQTDIGIEFEVLLGLIALIAAGVVAALGLYAPTRYAPAAGKAHLWKLNAPRIPE